MARPWVTPDNVKEYSDLEDVLNRSEKKLKYDIQRAEAYIISFTNNSFSDDDYPGGVPEDVKLADVILAEYFDDYAYTSSSSEIDVKTLGIDTLLESHLRSKASEKLTMRLRKL